MRRLKKEALASMKFHGHDPSRFRNWSPTLAESHCVRCGKWVQVNTKPAPNEIDVGGTAVALGCN